MSDSSSTPANETPWADALVDSLLQQRAQNEGGDDDVFLNSVEAAIDRAERETVIPLHQPRPATPKNGKRLAWSAGIAATIVAGIAVTLMGIRLTQDPPMPPSIVAEVADESHRLELSTQKTSKPKAAAAAIVESNIRLPGENRYTPSQPSLKSSPQSKSSSPVGNSGSTDYNGPYTAPVTSVAENYVVRLQERVKQADEAALRGTQLQAEGDYQGAIDQYHAAIDLLPEAPMTEERETAYKKQFAKASNSLARQRADEGRYPESIYLVEEVLQPSMDPDNLDARRLLEQLNDPDYYSPALTPSHLERVRRVKLAIKTAQGYMDLGDHDRADREFNLALNDDPYNEAARRGMEVNERHRMNYFDTAYDHTRAKMLREVAAGWETPAPTTLDGDAKVSGPLHKQSIPSPDSDLIVSIGSGIQAGYSSDYIFYGTRLQGQALPPMEANTSRYGELIDNSWQSPLQEPLSTFSIDVDTASMSNVRGLIARGATRDQIPHDSVRIEELVNYFDWDYPQPTDNHPFAFAAETAECPWNRNHTIMRIGVQGKEIRRNKRPDTNLVFLLDVSGSMNKPNKLPLVKQAISVLVEELNENDRVSIVVYAGSQGLALPTTSGADQAAITAALDRLDAGGSTNGGAGIKLAYKMAQQQFIEDGVNRVILCTDGDFNVGITGDEDLVSLVEKKAEGGVFLSVCGFGTDNLNDAMLEEITNRGNGNYFYIDTFNEARKVFLQDMMGTLVTIAKDVKIQVEFNPGKVAAYRLIGYANRRLEAEDFENDEIDAGEVGAGHSVTALYEVVPVGADENPALSGDLRYQKPAQPALELVESDEIALLKLRYKQPDGDTSILMSQPVLPIDQSWRRASDDFRFASAVGLFGLILREHESAKDSRLRDVINLAGDVDNNDPHGYRREFVRMVEKLKENEQE
ncbi:MAG: von Willebrand factor type A domain-containing protein [Verrucomicrobiales bacterium]|nr:von Willebrand factor type A domain-containing protein [Verrucomicrobiales bacterium]